MNRKKNLPFSTALSALLWFLLDILSKKAATLITEPLAILGPFLYLKPIQHNTGIAFGIPVPLWAQIGGSLVILAVLFRLAGQGAFFGRKDGLFKPILFGIIVGGAFGNLFDRITRGHVADFIVLPPIPVFNVADIGITLGLIILFILTLTKGK